MSIYDTTECHIFIKVILQRLLIAFIKNFNIFCAHLMCSYTKVKNIGEHCPPILVPLTQMVKVNEYDQYSYSVRELFITTDQYMF